MSQWTHIRGGLELVSSAYEQKPMKIAHPKEEDFADKDAYEEAIEKWRAAYHKSLYLPYPEEQFKLDVPTLRQRYNRKTKKEYTTLSFHANIYSLPRAKKYIKEAFNLMPQGELGFRYSVEQSILDSSSSSSGFMHNCLYKYYKEAHR